MPDPCCRNSASKPTIVLPGLRPVALALSLLLTVECAHAQSARQRARTAVADPQWSAMVFGGASAGRTRMIELVVAPWSGDYADNYFVGAAATRRLARFNANWTVDLEIGAGYRFMQVNAPEAWTAVFLRYDGFPWNNRITTTVGMGTGVSLVERVSEIEKDAGAHHGHPNGSKLLQYLAPEITFAAPERRNSDLVFRVHHRSGVFGTYDGIRGGSNVVTLGFRQRW
jgi:hypothetical protein